MARRPEKRIRVRSKSLDEVDETKLALAVWLMAKGIVEDRTTKDAEATDGSDSPADGSEAVQ